MEETRVVEQPSAEPLQEPRVATPAEFKWKKFGFPLVILLGLMGGLLLFLHLVPPARSLAGRKTLHRIPAAFDGWISKDYQMSEEAFKTLMPEEYVSRIYRSRDGQVIDFTVIAASHTRAFHNPKLCFRTQLWVFTENYEDFLEVPGLKHKIPVRVVPLVHANEPTRKSVGMFFYRTPLGMRSDTFTARILLFLGRLVGFKQQTYFVRFIKPSSGDLQKDKEELKRFATEILSHLKKTNPEIVS